MPLSPRVRTGLLFVCATNAATAVVAAPSLASDPGSPVVVPLVASPPVELALVPTPPPTTPPPRPTPRPVGAAAAPGAPGSSRQVVSTAYCLDGITASGGPVGPGQAAMNGVPLGSRWAIGSGPLAGVVLVVTDRIGHGSELDVWFDDCDAAREYGRRTVAVERVA